MNRETAAADMAIFQYTSGTTREMPAPIKHTHRAIVVVMNAALYGTGMRPGDRFFCPSSPAWGHGLWHGTLAPLALGIETGAYAGKFDAERLLQGAAGLWLDEFVGGGDPLPDDEEHRPRSGLIERPCEKLSFTGEPIDQETLSFIQDAFGVPLCSMYGTTEVGVILANYPGAAGLPGQGRIARPAGSRVSRSRCSGRMGPRCAAGRARRDQGASPRRLVSRPRIAAGSTRTAISTMPAAPTTSSSPRAGP